VSLYKRKIASASCDDSDSFGFLKARKMVLKFRTERPKTIPPPSGGFQSSLGGEIKGHNAEKKLCRLALDDHENDENIVDLFPFACEIN